MKLLLLLAIKAYWRHWPRLWQRTCLHSESCSRHVYRITAEDGVMAGLRALRRRVKNCRPGYLATCECGIQGLRLKDGTFLPHDMLSPAILRSMLHHTAELEQMLSLNGGLSISPDPA